MITSMGVSVTQNDLWPWSISSRSISHDLLKKLLKYATSCLVRSTARTVLNGLFPYWARLITSLRGCVAHNDPWTWTIFSRSFSHECAKETAKIWPILSCLLYSMCSPVTLPIYGLYSYVAHIHPVRGRCVICWTISRSIGQWSRSHGSFEF